MPGRLRSGRTRAVSLSSIMALAFLGAALGNEAAVAKVNCGQTIKTDTTLHRDLIGCPSNGIVIGADDVTLDLNGHRIVGDGKLVKSCPDREICDVGVAAAGHDDVTVRAGSVSKFALGVSVYKARRTRVARVSATKNLFFGIFMRASARSVLSGNSASGNLAPDGDGIGLFDSNHVRILGNSLRRNAQVALHVEGSHDNLIKGNLFARNGDIGIGLEGDRNQMRRNRCVSNGTACILAANGNHNVILRNRISGGGDGIGVENGRGNLVARNVLRGVAGNGIYLGLSDPPIGGARNVIRRNVVVESDKDAYLVHGPDHRSVLAYNVAKRAGDDGFDIGSRSATLRGNRSFGAHDLGIEAVRGVDDGGGNSAQGSGDPRGCTNISCS